jgi:hypothetical protein
MTAATVSRDPGRPSRSQIPVLRFMRPEAGRFGSEPDWAGLWFDVVEELSGEFVGMRGGRLCADGRIAWTYMPHASYDGLGGFVHLLRQETGFADIRIPVRRSRKPTWLQRMAALLRVLAEKPRTPAVWKSQDLTWRQQSAEPCAGTAIATVLFDTDRTRRLEGKARKLAVSVNDLILSALARASQSELSDGPLVWMMPVNLRGPVALARDTANHTGYLQIVLGRDATPAQAREQVKEGLRRRMHWGSWTLLNAGRIFGYSGMRRIYQLQLARYKGRPFVGAFSNLGCWEGYGQWFVCPPVTLTCPVGTGAIICNGKLSLTLEAHPSISSDPAWARGLMDRWVAELGI